MPPAVDVRRSGPPPVIAVRGTGEQDEYDADVESHNLEFSTPSTDMEGFGSTDYRVLLDSASRLCSRPASRHVAHRHP